MSAVATTLRLQLLRFRRGKRLHVGVGAALLVVGAVAAVGHTGDATKAFDGGLKWGIYNLLAFILPYLYTANAIGDEVVGRTLPFLTTRSLSRWSLSFGKYLAGYLMTVGILVPAVLLLHLALHITDPSALMDSLPMVLRAVVALALLCAFYCALCLLAGALIPDATGITALIYFGAIEFMGSMAPSYIRCGSMNFLAQRISGLPASGPWADSAPEIPYYVGAPVIAAVAILFIGLAGLTVQTSEFSHQRA